MFLKPFDLYIIVGDVDIAFDEDGFKLPAFQCVFQYLKRFMSNDDLSKFNFKPENPVEGDFTSCISTVSKWVTYSKWFAKNTFAEQVTYV